MIAASNMRERWVGVSILSKNVAKIA